MLFTVVFWCRLKESINTLKNQLRHMGLECSSTTSDSTSVQSSSNFGDTGSTSCDNGSTRGEKGDQGGIQGDNGSVFGDQGGSVYGADTDTSNEEESKSDFGGAGDGFHLLEQS
jgi:hypothetical protein